MSISTRPQSSSASASPLLTPPSPPIRLARGLAPKGPLQPHVSNLPRRPARVPLPPRTQSVSSASSSSTSSSTSKSKFKSDSTRGPRAAAAGIPTLPTAAVPSIPLPAPLQMSGIQLPSLHRISYALTREGWHPAPAVPLCAGSHIAKKKHGTVKSEGGSAERLQQLGRSGVFLTLLEHTWERRESDGEREKEMAVQMESFDAVVRICYSADAKDGESPSASGSSSSLSAIGSRSGPSPSSSASSLSSEFSTPPTSPLRSPPPLPLSSSSPASISSCTNDDGVSEKLMVFRLPLPTLDDDGIPTLAPSQLLAGRAFLKDHSGGCVLISAPKTFALDAFALGVAVCIQEDAGDGQYRDPTLDVADPALWVSAYTPVHRTVMRWHDLPEQDWDADEVGLCGSWRGLMSRDGMRWVADALVGGGVLRPTVDIESDGISADGPVIGLHPLADEGSEDGTAMEVASASSNTHPT